MNVSLKVSRKFSDSKFHQNHNTTKRTCIALYRSASIFSIVCLTVSQTVSSLDLLVVVVLECSGGVARRWP